MQRLYALLICFVSMLWCTFCLAQDIRDYVEIAAPSAQIDIAVLDTSPFKLAGDDQVDYLISDRQYIHLPGQRESYFRLATRPKTISAVEQEANVALTFDPAFERVIIHRIDVLRDGARREMLDLSKMDIFRAETERDRLIFNGTLQISYPLPDVRPGDIIDFAYSIVGTNPALGDHFSISAPHRFDVPVRFMRNALISGSDTEVHINGHNGAPLPDIQETGATRRHVWIQEDVAGRKSENNRPPRDYFHPMTQVSTFGSWRDLGRHFAPVYAVPASLPQELKDIAASIRSSQPSKQEQARAALDYVQTEIRYLGIELGAGGYVPRQPASVLRNRFGDCKDMVVLLNSLLGLLDIQADPLLVSLSERGAVKNSLPSHRVFDHVISHVQINGRSYFLDPTTGPQLGDLDNLQQGAFDYGVVIADDSSGMISAKPGQPAFYEIYRDTFRTSQDTDEVTFENVSTYVQGSADRMLDRIQTRGLETIETDFLHYFQDRFDGLEQAEAISYTVDTQRAELTITSSYHIPNGWKRDEEDPDVRYLSIWPYDFLSSLPESAQGARQSDYAIDQFRRVKHELKLHIDDDWEVWASSNNKINDAFRFDVEQTYYIRVLSQTLSYVSRSDRIEADDFVHVMAELEDIKDSYGVYITQDDDFFSDLSEEDFERLALAYLIALALISLCGAYLRRNVDASWRKEQIFYPVSVFKFLLLNIVTLGIYYLFWAYKNWHWLHETGRHNSKPLLYALFAPITNFWLFRKFTREAVPGYAGFRKLAVPLAILLIVANAISFTSPASDAANRIVVWITFFSLIMPLPAVMQVLQLNRSNGKHVQLNSRLTLPVWGLVLIFLPLFILYVIGSFV
ncbi:MAG: DUF3857 domain-containing protein [Pseudomonadota bacterium]